MLASASRLGRSWSRAAFASGLMGRCSVSRLDLLGVVLVGELVLIGTTCTALGFVSLFISALLQSVW